MDSDQVNMISNSRVRRLLVAAAASGLLIKESDSTADCWTVHGPEDMSLTIYGEGQHAARVMLDDQVSEWHEVTQLDALKLIMEWEE